MFPHPAFARGLSQISLKNSEARTAEQESGEREGAWPSIPRSAGGFREAAALILESALTQKVPPLMEWYRLVVKRVDERATNL